MLQLVARSLVQGDVIIARGRPVEICATPCRSATGMVLHYRAPDIDAGMMLCPADHRLDVVRLLAVDESRPLAVR